ncbi:Protein KIAA0100 [Eumeta japonica]|uniref:Protein KIAA0100 n=1 Tax=Eumeta variegata TaxID=151549 RepID=A0A4C1TT09_EUMVA|nr:Protein KIAA0100 [Eumeta japonica]
MDTAKSGCLISASALELHADGAAGGPARTLVFSTSLVDSNIQIYSPIDQKLLGELSCSILIEGSVKVDGPLNVEINSRFSAAAVVVDGSASVKTNLPQIYIEFQLDQLKLDCGTEKLLFLHKLKLDAKLEKGVLNLYLIISTLNILYDHKEVFSWYSNMKHNMKHSQVLQLTDTKPKMGQGGCAGERNKPETIDTMKAGAPTFASACALFRQLFKGGSKRALPLWLQRVFAACIVQGCAELRSGTLHLRLKNSAAAIGCGGLKVKLDQLLDTRATRHWSAELLVDAGWAATGRAALTLTEPPHRKCHAWGTTALLGVALVKWGSHGPKDSKVEAMMDCLRLEWSTDVTSTIMSAVECIEDYKKLSPVKHISTNEVIPEKNSSISVNVAMSHINVFLIIDDTMCLMMRIDAISLEKILSKSSVAISGLKVVDMVPYKGAMSCQRAEEILITFFHVKFARIEYVPSKHNDTVLLDIQFIENVDLEWSANLHLKILTFVRAVQTLKDDIQVRTARIGNDLVKKKGHGKRLHWRITFKGETNLGLILSEENNVLFVTDDMTIGCDEVGLSIAWAQLKMILNGHEVLNVDGYTMERVVDDADIRIERKANEEFVLPWNKVWSVHIESIRLIFPYKHRFAQTIQGDFVSLFKWIKFIHNVKKKPFTSESPLPSDLCIKIDELLIEMSDDPFEVKLRDNYELLEDEYKESQKRRTMLDAKVQELCKPHLFLPAGKVEELYSALRQKDAQIYVQRCRAAPPPRTRLVACILTRIRILALADLSMHGTQAAVAHMRNIDFDSPWPEDGIEFTTLWCRAVTFHCDEWQLLLRDFPQPLLSMARMRFWGTLMGAEEQPPARAVRTVVVEQGAPWGPFSLERSMMPLKFYYDLCCEMEQFSYAFGPCWEPVIAQCNLSFDQVSRPSLDPSLPLAWWDKVRLLMHGRLTANFQRFTCLLHVSLDPYNTTEEMELTWHDLVLDWTNGKLGFLGELNVYVRTASKYDDCRVLHVPNFRVSVKLGWQCVGDPRDHHAVAPCAPDRLPEYSSNQEHDSYRAFRSQGLDLHLSLETKPSDITGPVLLLYGSTLRWFESLKLILSGITRPTRRGRVFKNVRPRRPQLSRHYRAVSVSLTLHNLQVVYWSSSSMQRGVEMLGLRVTCGSKHCLSLVPCNDGLVRRPRANWTTVYMNCDLNDAEIWLKSAMAMPDQPADDKDKKDRDDEEESVSLNTPIEKCYCLSVRRVSYGREASGCGTTAAPTHRLAVHDLRGAWTKLNRDVAFALLDTYIKTQQLKKNLSTKALKEDVNTATSPKHQRDLDVVSPPPTGGVQASGSTAGTACAEGMLAQLVAEAGAEPPVVFPDELSGGEADPPQHPPPRPPLDDDSAHDAWLIELVNSQVLLKGCETRGYVILCAARAEVRQRVRRTPAAVAWRGAFSAMQYYATVSAGDKDQLDENIQWVSVEEITERGGQQINTLPDVPRLVGSGHSAGGVIGRTVGPSSDTNLTQYVTKNWDFVNATVFLGLTLNNRFQWGPHISKLAKRLSSAVYAVQKIRNLSDVETARLVYFGCFHSLMSYGFLLWGNAAEVHRIFVLQKLAVRAIYKLGPCESLRIQYNAQNFAAVKLVTKVSQWRKIGTQGRRKKARELQRIVSRCACEFYYVSHDEADSSSGSGGAAGWTQRAEPYDSFKLMHHDLDVCTNSLQYAMLLDVVNNVVLHVEPERRRTLERRARMRFQLQLHHDEDPRRMIHKLQTQVRESLTRLRRLEKEYYLKRRALTDNDPAGVEELKSLDTQVNECKESVLTLGEELDAMIRAWREVWARGAAPPVRSAHAPPHRLNEICFKSARWRLTDADGQLGIADLLLTNFLYTKTSRSDDSVEHQLELGYVRVTNLLPNEPFPEVLVPQAPSGRAPLARRAALRVFCRDRPPVGGISVKEHFEVNVVPIRIGLTKKFFNTMLKFCFPERDPDNIEGTEGEDKDDAAGSSSSHVSKKGKKKSRDSNSNFYVKRDKDKDDVEKMKERAEKNKLFIYIKIPEVPVRVSYKGSKEKNLEDVRDLPLVLPTLEYHNVTWTWLDLLLATKTDTRRVLLSQAIRQKLQLHRRAAADPAPHEEDKARLLLGERTQAYLQVAENKPQKKGAPSVFKFAKPIDAWSRFASARGRRRRCEINYEQECTGALEAKITKVCSRICVNRFFRSAKEMRKAIAADRVFRFISTGYLIAAFAQPVSFRRRSRVDVRGSRHAYELER